MKMRRIVLIPIHGNLNAIKQTYGWHFLTLMHLVFLFKIFGNILSQLGNEKTADKWVNTVYNRIAEQKGVVGLTT